MRVDVPAALEGQLRDDPNFSRLTIDACAVQVRAAVACLCVAKDWAKAAERTGSHGYARNAADQIEDALRLLEGAPERSAIPRAKQGEGE